MNNNESVRSRHKYIIHTYTHTYTNIKALQKRSGRFWNLKFEWCILVGLWVLNRQQQKQQHQKLVLFNEIYDIQFFAPSTKAFIYLAWPELLMEMMMPLHIHIFYLFLNNWILLLPSHKANNKWKMFSFTCDKNMLQWWRGKNIFCYNIKSITLVSIINSIRTSYYIVHSVQCTEWGRSMNG